MSSKKPSRLVVVANRGPLRASGAGSKRRWARATGGLVTALDPVLRSRGGTWISSDQYEGLSDQKPVLGKYRHVHVPLSRSDHHGFYHGISNAVLWPFLHSFPPTIRIGAAPWAQYVKANEAFADAILANSKPRDLLWIQDYHLMLVPSMVRKRRKAARIGWFCHVPWPSEDVFRILPWRNEILEGLLRADLLGFHTKSYVENFLRCVQRLTPFRVRMRQQEVDMGSRTVRVVAEPIGVPVEALRSYAEEEWVQQEAARIRQSLGGRRIVLGVDRLDYTKGIPERIFAFERLLESRREAKFEYAFVQVMVPSRTGVRAYASLKAEVDRLVGNVNGRFGTTGRVPIHYLYRNLDQRTLFAHYLAADVGLVTPLRDGMNLVAHEYVLAQQGKEGALILSEFAGAAEYLDGAFPVNPYSEDVIADAILEVSRTERPELKRRMARLNRAVASMDVNLWAERFVGALDG